MTETVYTVGHSTHSISNFLALLRIAKITAVSDVRSRPYSATNPQFNRETLQAVLKQHGIKYVFLGKELGARSDDPTCYKDGKVQYEILAKTELFQKGLARVKEGAAQYRIALMCAEKEPLDCHRTILVARELLKDDICVKHILSDGRIENQEQSIKRLIGKLGVKGSDMFRSDETVQEEAYARQSDEIAYRRKLNGVIHDAGARR